MTLNELKLYNVRVDQGSGCLFQPISQEQHTYILTAKHLFEFVGKDIDGNEIIRSKQDGSKIPLFRLLKSGNSWIEEEIPFILKRGETYFPHKEADAVILKINYLDSYDKIFTSPLPEKVDSYSVYGYPSRIDNNAVGNKDTSYQLRSLVGPAITSYTAQLVNGVLRKDDIEGMSGGGIMCIYDTYISLIGIQSEMKHPAWANGQINFVPMEYFNEIINYPENLDSLVQLYPPYMNSFDFLKSESFKLEVDSIDENKIKSTRILLRNKALNIISSDLTPRGIKELFKTRLLIDEQEANNLSIKAIWIAWLEFLTIMNIVKYENIDKSMLTEIFNSYRLKYSSVQDWTELIPDGLSRSDYMGLKPDATVIVSTKKSPNRTFLLPKGKIIDIANVYDKSGFRTDKGIDPFTSFNFIHLDYFKTQCIMNKVEEYANLDEVQLLQKLKGEYHELFH